MEFNTKCRYNCFGKQSHIDTCTQAFLDLERFGFEFGDIGFAWDHVHFLVNIPKQYSVDEAEIMQKPYRTRKMFELQPGFRNGIPIAVFGVEMSILTYFFSRSLFPLLIQISYIETFPRGVINLRKN